ncbi:hypothetical protein B0H67DRAFT_137452 [Lasiosphaeris hirsuta]|uniref:Uncharacterized protein n=1 Tax=Lasiosphaeris hirsuta TaxID=260670 RepID=A0AA40E7W6_9PEZI|nr:hypothetical protein B0H67DRAFT_137452 [Lasiosphaeris hirsuta]
MNTKACFHLPVITRPFTTDHFTIPTQHRWSHGLSAWRTLSTPSARRTGLAIPSRWHLSSPCNPPPEASTEHNSRLEIPRIISRLIPSSHQTRRYPEFRAPNHADVSGPTPGGEKSNCFLTQAPKAENPKGKREEETKKKKKHTHILRTIHKRTRRLVETCPLQIAANHRAQRLDPKPTEAKASRHQRWLLAPLCPQRKPGQPLGRPPVPPTAIRSPRKDPDMRAQRLPRIASHPFRPTFSRPPFKNIRHRARHKPVRERAPY